MSIVIRNYREGDLEAIVEVMNLASAADGLDLGTSLTELRERFARPGFHAEDNVFVAEDEAGRVVASAHLELAVSPERAIFHTFSSVHPDWRDRGIGRLLLERLWKRAQERRHEAQSERVYFYAYCATHQAQRIALYESFGLRPVRYSLYMVCRSLENLAQPQVPSGVEIRPYIQGRDDESALEAMNEAFAEDWEFVPLTRERWDQMISSSVFPEGLSVVGVEGEEVVGICLVAVMEGRSRQLGRKDGFINDLCVRPAYRRRGLGTALLLTALHALSEAGMESASLDTDTDNPNKAMRLYEKVGFQELWRWVKYGREMR